MYKHPGLLLSHHKLSVAALFQFSPLCATYELLDLAYLYTPYALV